MTTSCPGVVPDGVGVRAGRAYDGPVDDFNCAVCMRRVNVEASFGDDRGGGYIPLTFPNEVAVNVWVHHHCLDDPLLRERRSQVRVPQPVGAGGIRAR